LLASCRRCCELAAVGFATNEVAVNHAPHYANQYENIYMRREAGILEVRFHTNDGPLIWSGSAHRDLGHAFEEIARDTDNRVVLLTGSGGAFCVDVATAGWGDDLNTTTGRDRIYWEGRRLLKNLLNIEVPIIAAVNGPAHMHAEIALLCDIVICASTTTFQDPHFIDGSVPGDGVHIVWPLLLGMNRGRYFQYTGQILSATEALELGLVGEILQTEKLLPRAWELARQLSVATTIQLRYTRIALTMRLQQLLEPGLGYGLMLEMFGALDDARLGRPRVSNSSHPKIQPS
jgi:enoyl-CoA hydratase/carnithine racemase